ncbi:MAG: hypothetical protein HC899_19615 [Leptolyngbyaceae cyanobacterium SM1_4_3]|nr:hypothetical protein [Leptolyngbyaceae cyanobacterium SM1_4_3]
MRLVYWGLAIGGFVLVVSWLWGALVAFSLLILLIVGYEIWRQSRPLALSRQPRKSNLKSDAAGLQSEAAPVNAGVKPAEKLARFRVRLVEEKPTRNSGKSNLVRNPVEQSDRAIRSQSVRGGDRTVIQEPLTLTSSADSNAAQDAAQSNSTADLTTAPTVIESLDQVRFGDGTDSNWADLTEEPTVQPGGKTPPRSSSSFGNPTVIRPHAAASGSAVAKPFQPPMTDEQTVAQPFQPTRFADEKTVIGTPKSKSGNEPTVMKPAKSGMGHPAADKADEEGDRPQAADKAKNSPLQTTDLEQPIVIPEQPTVIGQQSQKLKQEEERTKL